MTSNQKHWLLVFWLPNLAKVSSLRKVERVYMPIPQTGREIRLTTLSACAG
jgi:hypothetical protein